MTTPIPTPHPQKVIDNRSPKRTLKMRDGGVLKVSLYSLWILEKWEQGFGSEGLIFDGTHVSIQILQIG